MNLRLLGRLVMCAVFGASLCNAAVADTDSPLRSTQELLAGRPSVLFIGPYNYVEPALARELMDAGYFVDASNWAGVNLDRLRRFNTVVVSSWGNPGDEWHGKYEDALDEYLQQGGGLITFFSAWEELALGLRPWFEKHGLEIVHEGISDPANARDVPRPKYLYGAKLTLTRAVHPHPVTQGVRSLWYPTGFGGYGKPGAMPLVVDDDWAVLVSSEDTAVINHCAEAVAPNFRPEMEGRQGAWPMMAARRIGNGRMVAIGLNPMLYVWGPHFDKWDEVAYRHGIGGVPSDFQTMLYNALRWTAEPSLTSGAMGYLVGIFPPTSQGDTAPVDWSTKAFTDPGPWLYGLMGAHTALSTGKGTVAEWAAAAKAEGLSFIVFLEDMREMSEEKWAELKAACKAASDDSFRAYPGMEFLLQVSVGTSLAGTNRGFVIDGRHSMPWLLDRHLTPENDVHVTDDDMKGTWTLAFGTHNTAGYMGHEQNDIPFWDYKNYGLLSVLAREGDRIIDDAIPQYLESAAANVNVMPMGISMEYDPADLSGIRADGRPLLVVNGAPDPRYPQMGAGLNLVDLHVGSRGEQWNAGIALYRGWYGPAVTEGPAVSLRFRSGYTWKRVEYPRYWIERYASVEHQDWFMPSYFRQPVRLDVACEAPISEVIVYDGPQVYLRFDARGEKTFTAEFTVPQDQNRHLVAYVKDAQGRRALTPELWTEQQQNLYNFCADRTNAPMGTGSSPGHGHLWTEGLLPMDTARKQTVAQYPRVIAGTGCEARRYQLDLVSGDLYLERASSDHYYTTANKYPIAWHNFVGPVPRDDVRHGWLRYEWYQKHGREYLHGAEIGFVWDGYPYGPGDETPQYAYYAQQDIWGETKSELQPVAGCNFVPGLSQIVWEGDLSETAPTQYAVHTPGGLAATGQLLGLSGGTTAGPLPDGSAIVLDSGFTVRVHGQGLGYAFFATDEQAHLRLAPISDGPIPAGTRYEWWFETVAQALPRPLDPDISWLTVQRGTLLGHFVGATLAAQDNVAQVSITRQPLPVNSTPLQVRGVNSNWTCGYYEPKTGLYRPLGSANGIAYAQVEASRSNLEVVIGNLVTCNQPEVRLSVVPQTDAEGQATGGWDVEAHNPTTTALETEFVVPAAFSLIQQRNHTAVIPAGDTVKFVLH